MRFEYIQQAVDTLERWRGFVPERVVGSTSQQVAAMEAKDRPIVYLYHRHWLWAYANKLEGFRTVPDGMRK